MKINVMIDHVSFVILKTNEKDCRIYTNANIFWQFAVRLSRFLLLIQFKMRPDWRMGVVSSSNCPSVYQSSKFGTLLYHDKIQIKFQFSRLQIMHEVCIWFSWAYFFSGRGLLVAILFSGVAKMYFKKPRLQHIIETNKNKSLSILYALKGFHIDLAVVTPLLSQCLFILFLGLEFLVPCIPVLGLYLVFSMIICCSMHSNIWSVHLPLHVEVC